MVKANIKSHTIYYVAEIKGIINPEGIKNGISVLLKKFFKCQIRQIFPREAIPRKNLLLFRHCLNRLDTRGEYSYEIYEIIS